jgi:crotonobetainyl-CoA:carnitine CoA-transferase CaiB-like acyl-CoA transferase
MLVGINRPQGGGSPVLTPGNPVRILTAPGTADTRVPWVGEDTDDLLGKELGLSVDEVAALRADGVVA